MKRDRKKTTPPAAKKKTAPKAAAPAAQADAPVAQPSAGRPTTYTPEAAALVIDSIKASYSQELAELMLLKISSIPKTIPEICAAHPELPSQSTLYNWLAVNKHFAEEFIQAMQIRALLMAEEWLHDVRTLTSDPKAYTVEKKDGVELRVADTVYLGLKRLSLDRIQWYVTKLLPRLLGDRQKADTPSDIPIVSEYEVPAARPIEGPARVVEDDAGSTTGKAAPKKTKKPARGKKRA